MPSKKSKPSSNPGSLWKSERACAETRVLALARELASELREGDRVLLEGPMGVGKSTFARALIQALGVDQPAEGSPTFSIAHEYQSPRGDVIHVDFYRLRSESEIDDAGITAYFWERSAIVITEWISMFEEFADAVRKNASCSRVWEVALEMDPSNPALRTIQVIQV